MPWYVKDWIASEDRARMTYEARGVYRDLLDYSWLHQGLPADHGTIANWLGVTVRKFALIWTMIAPCWQERDGRYVNRKQEEVRRDLDAYRSRKQKAGSAGGKKRAANRAESKQTTSSASSTPLVEVKPAFAFASAEIPPDQLEGIPQTSRRFAAPPPLVRSPIDLAKAMARCAYVGARLEVPHKLHADFRRALGGSNADARLEAWYATVDEEIERSGESILPDVFPWLHKRFKEWASAQQADADLERFRPQEA